MSSESMLEQRNTGKKEVDVGAKTEIVTAKYEVTMFGTQEKNREIWRKNRETGGEQRNIKSL